MQPTIIIDAGHGGFDNGASYNGRLEKDDNLKLALAVGEQLERDGFPVVYTRETDVYQRPIDKARIANESGGDYFVSFHRNSSPNPNTYSGVETLVYNDSGIPAQLARSVNDKMAGAGFNNLGVSVRPDLIVLRRTKMPAILIEAGFINTEADNRTFDENFNELATGIAKGIENVVGTKSNEKAFGVQVGLYKRYENAQYALNQLVANGYEAQIREWNNFYAVVVGNESTLDGARDLERRLQNAGYDTLIVNL
ncbi:MAG: N-acetylmuramoyl-L-alanine amidase [Lachnospiraceae bacterium]|nr:N-acetylmuramoyl-L-alanine amidase [Lachnospiraceae bacterium]